MNVSAVRDLLGLARSVRRSLAADDRVRTATLASIERDLQRALERGGACEEQEKKREDTHDVPCRFWGGVG